MNQLIGSLSYKSFGKMQSAEVIVGVQRVLVENKESGWNNKGLRWTVTHSTSKFTKQHQIQLDMTLISSERTVSVDGEVKSKHMCSFGFKSEFQISPCLKGAIIQDGIGFELYLNGRSFTDCSKQDYSYQPPVVASNNVHAPSSWKPQPSKPIPPPPLKQTQSQGPTLVKQKSLEGQPMTKKEKSESGGPTQQSIKSMQSQAMKILIAHKKEKKASSGH